MNSISAPASQARCGQTTRASRIGLLSQLARYEALKALRTGQPRWRRSHMDGPLAHRKRRLLDRFRTGRMRVTGTRQILGRTTKLHQYGGFVNHFAGLAADDMHAKHPIRFRIRENLDEAAVL